MSGDHDDLEMVLELVLVEPVRFAQKAPGAVARDGVANLAAGHDPDCARLVRCREHVGDCQAAVIPATVIVDPPKLTGAQQVLLFRE